jgi:hypothetical protein
LFTFWKLSALFVIPICTGRATYHIAGITPRGAAIAFERRRDLGQRTTYRNAQEL